ncbi:MAG: hypothetical protein ACHQ0J_05635 [Candidatus Dormibacterales bacterium]
MPFELHRLGLRVAALAAILTLSACGSSQPNHPSANSPTPHASALPSAASNSLFVIASGLPGPQLVNSSPGTPTSLEIVDSTGHVHAQTTFQPPPAPMIGNAAALLQSPVRTAAGAAYFADNTGQIRRLTPDGTVSMVAKFPLTNSQQELSYAVSPDGAHLMAIVLSTPPLHVPPPQTIQDPLFVDGGHWSLSLETADAGGATSTTLQKDLGTAYPKPTEIVGWDSKGPLATLNTGLGAQAQPLSAHFFGSDLGGAALIHLAADGTHLDRIGGSDCLAVDEIADGTVVCGTLANPAFSVRDASGNVLWQASQPTQYGASGPWLSPDGNAIAVQGFVLTRTGAASASRLSGSADLVALGWLNAAIVVMATLSGGDISLYSANGLTLIRSLGVSGVFEGAL